MSRSEREKVSHREIIRVYWRILGYLKRYLWLAVICVALSVTISLCYFGSLGMIKPLGDIVFEDGTAELTKTLKGLGHWGERLAEFLQGYLRNDKYRILYWMMGVVIVLALFKNALRFLEEIAGQYLTLRIVIDISNDLYLKVKRLPVSFFTTESESKITARFVNDIQVMGRGIENVFTRISREPFKALASLALALMIDWKLTLLIVGVFPLAVFFIKYLGKKVKQGTKKTLVQQGNVQTILQETFQGIKTVKSYQMEGYLQQKFERGNRKLLRYQLKIAAADAAASPIMETFITFIGVGVLLFSAHMVLGGDMSSGDFCAFYAALAAVLDPVRKMASVYNRISGSASAGERVFELMDRPSEVDNPGSPELPDMKDSIEFRDVSFSYRPAEVVLHNISFKVMRGECIAVVGPSGAGKSTLVSLLSRFYDPDSGAIFIDGVDIRTAKLSSLRRQIGLVTQEPFLFHDTILANIVVNDGDGAPGEVIQAAQSAHAHHFVEGLPHGYRTHYGEDHVDLSGGQKHRIALARAFFKTPGILILDEAMASLDAESEGYIKKALEKITTGRTTFIIAHRFSTIEKASRILVIGHGGLMEGIGTHDEVWRTSPTYRNLYERQLIGR